MQDKLAPAIEALQGQLQNQLDEVAETKKAINALCRAMGKEPMYRDVIPEQAAGGALRRDRYYGRPLATVAQEYLEVRREASTPEEIYEGLKAGNFDFKALNWGGTEKDWIRNLSISLAKNTKAFHRLPNGAFGLVTWYPEIAVRRERETKADKSKASVPAGEELSDSDEAPASAK
jgi:hypothetical protein